VNETGAAWTRNREKFEVKRSWYSQQDLEDIKVEIKEFEAIWHDQDPGLLVLPLPQAVKERLQNFAPPDHPPQHDPMEIELMETGASLQDRIAAQRLMDAPRLPGGEQLVTEALWADGKPFELFPHQERVVRRAAAEFPQSFLFCDEVGLGKTIEAGLALRSLMLKGHIGRSLVIAPRSLIRQWMEELREKFALTAWFYDGRSLMDVGGRVRFSASPLEEDGIVIASRHLLARSDRQDEILGVSRSWELIIVDEAHAARQKVFGTTEPNQFLKLLQNLKNAQLFSCLWLLTATPMQLDPREVHDLMLLLGLDSPTWGEWASLPGFVEFFDNLRAFHQNSRIRSEVIRMTRTAVAHGAPELDAGRAPKHWKLFPWQRLLEKIRTGSGLMLALQQLHVNYAEAMTPLLSTQTPLAVYMFRHTRATLRAYQERGLVRGLAARSPEDIPVVFRSDVERELYHRIDELCSRFYRMADLPSEERNGVGFLMAVFRKRLASSFAAFQKSLERRRDLIEAIERDFSEFEVQIKSQRDSYGEDEEDDEIDIGQAIDAERRRLLRLHYDPERRHELQSERVYLQDYIMALGQISRDSKFEAFRERLSEVLEDGKRVIIFTQFLDTLDFIRDKLVAHFGEQIACYSGRGGEIWNPNSNAWQVVEKSEVKARCRIDHPRNIRILLGTEAASEGLNLQQFSALVNYDLPWNPMRVEQRIGRIDRIGQEASTVRILNLYLQDTIEEDAYHTLKNRIGVFEEVVGPLQPILAEMPRIFRRVARGELELAEARRLLDEAAQERPDTAISSLEDYVRQDIEDETLSSISEPPASQVQLAAWCLAHPASGMRIMSVPEPGTGTHIQDGTRGCLSIAWAYAPPHLGIGPTEETLATFSGELADRHPPTGPTQNEDGSAVIAKEGVRLLTWGDPYLQAWLAAIRGDPLTDDEYRRAEIFSE